MKVDGRPVGDNTLRSEALTLTISTGEGGKELEAMSEKGSVGTSEVQYESHAAEMENATETSCPSASGEKDECLSEKGIDGCTVGMEVSKRSEADIGKDFTNGCSDVLTTESMDGSSPLQPSAAEGSHMERLESDEVMKNNPVLPENVLKKSEGDITDGNAVIEANQDMLASASIDTVLPPCSDAMGNQVISDADVTNNADHFMLENASAESKADTTDGKEDVHEGSSDMLATTSADRESSPSSLARSSETDFANSNNDCKQENVMEDSDQPCSSAAEGDERMSEKDLTAGTGVQQESEEQMVTEDERGSTAQDLELSNTEEPENTANTGVQQESEEHVVTEDERGTTAQDSEISNTEEAENKAGTVVQQKSEEHTVTEDGRGTTTQDMEIDDTETPENKIPSLHPSPTEKDDNNTLSSSPAAEGDNNTESLPEKELAESSVASEEKDEAD